MDIKYNAFCVDCKQIGKFADGLLEKDLIEIMHCPECGKKCLVFTEQTWKEAFGNVMQIDWEKLKTIRNSPIPPAPKGETKL